MRLVRDAVVPLLRGGAAITLDTATARVRSAPVPRLIDGLDAAWFESALQDCFPGVSVREATQLSSDLGTTTHSRFALHYRDRGAGVSGMDLPETVFAKSTPAGAATKLLGQVMGHGGIETMFNVVLAPSLSVRTPRTFHGVAEPWSGRFILVQEDLSQACDFRTLLQPCTAEEAAAVTVELARLHVSYWADDFRGGLARFGFDAHLRRQALGSLIVRAGVKACARKHPNLLPAQRLSDLENAARSLDSVTRVCEPLPHTLIHGDTHLGNLLWDGTRPGFVDWQLARQGSPIRDLAYFLATSTEPETRRKVERELLDRYRDELASQGVTAPAKDAGWSTYRLGAIHALIAAAATVGIGGMQHHDIAVAGLRRSLAAVEDLDSFGLLHNLIENI